MSVICQDDETGEITFYMKGADIVMQSIIQYNDWLDEEVCHGDLDSSPRYVVK